jgi:hypothetical protein
MGDEDRSRELPQRERGMARGGSGRSTPSPVLSEEVRRRIQAAVKAERAGEAAQGSQTTTDPGPRATPASSEVTSAAVNGIPGQRKDVAKPERPARASHGGKPGHVAKPQRAPKQERAAKPERTAEPPRSAENVRADHEPADPGHGHVPAQDGSGRPEPPEDHARIEKGSEWIRLLALVLVLMAVGSLVTAASLYVANSSSSGDAEARVVLQHQEVLASRQAASWVAQQVNRDDVVSCDRAMCDALESEGFPASKVLMLGPTSPPPVTSAVVVVTAVVRSMFGSSIDAAWAPAVLASFGSGSAQITVRVIAPHGAGAYQAALSVGLAGRMNNGKLLLDSNRIVLSSIAGQQLATGQVDARLVLAIESLAAYKPVEVVEFGNVGPGASQGLPLRFADLAENGQAAGLSSSAYVRAMQAHLSAENIQFRPLGSQTVVLPGGKDVLQVEFAAPSPLGPISAQGSP